MRCFFLTAVLVVALVSNAHAFFNIINNVADVSANLVEGENPDFDYEGQQLTKKGATEIEADDGRDEEFDNQVCDNYERPHQPHSAEITGLFLAKRGEVAEEAKRNGLDLSQVNPAKFPTPIAYFTDRSLWKPQLKCCPKIWNYGCRHTVQRMPCFVNYQNHQREWCCPLWPGVYTARCLCNNCHIQTSSCIHSGRCLKRYTRKSFLAVCYRGGWGYLRFFNKWIPSSCYCSVRRPYYSNLELDDQKCSK